MTLNSVELQDFIWPDIFQPGGSWEAESFGPGKHSKKMVVESLNDQDRTQKHLKPYQTKKVKGNRKGRTWFFPGLVSDAERLEKSWAEPS